MIGRRTLGRTRLAVGVLGFGGAEIGFERVDVAIVRRLVADALDAGLNVIDTILGTAIADRRRDYHLFTKCGHFEGTGRDDCDRNRSSAASPAASRGCAPTTSTSCSCTPAPRTTCAAATSSRWWREGASAVRRASWATAATARRRATRWSAGASTCCKRRSTSPIRKPSS
jgi:hypothetical protein